jgi:hypothetical protein
MGDRAENLIDRLVRAKKDQRFSNSGEGPTSVAYRNASGRTAQILRPSLQCHIAVT